jgi:ATPase subunit of ABC transporter with duplicated ATPase domains
VIAFSSVTKQYGGQILFVDASFQINPGEKVGLVGPNGAGKSTVFRLIVGDDAPDDGNVEKPRKLTVGYFRQDVGELRGRSILAETCAGAGEVADLAEELAVLTTRLETDPTDDVVTRYGEVQARYQDLGGYELEARAQEILHGLGFHQEQMHQDVGTLSGGWKMRVALAQILLAKPELLLLDEPTNYLDIESILWLETFLRDYAGTVVMTCHDREIMNRVVKKIVEIDGGALRTYGGNYDFYEQARQIEAERREAEYARQQAMLAKESRFIERFKTHVAKAAQVQSRLKKLDKIEKIAEPKRFIEKNFDFRAPQRSGDDVVRMESLRKAYGTRVVHDNLTLTVRRKERWAVMGENGAGKSTLLKMIAGDDGLLRPARDGPAVERSHRARGVAGACTEREPGHAAQPRRRVRLPRRRRVQADQRPVRWREGARRAREAALRRTEPARPRRADEPPRHRDQARAGQGTERLRGHADLRVPRSAVPQRARDPRARAIDGRCPDLRRQLRRVRRLDRPRSAWHARVTTPSCS